MTGLFVPVTGPILVDLRARVAVAFEAMANTLDGIEDAELEARTARNARAMVDRMVPAVVALRLGEFCALYDAAGEPHGFPALVEVLSEPRA